MNDESPYVRICPICNHVNPEDNKLCDACRQPILLVEAIPRPPATETPTRRFLSNRLSVKCTDGKVLAVSSGDRIGQAHSSSQAEIQLPATLDGVDKVHRYHCRFEQQNPDGWYVTAIDNSERGFTNPTLINGRPLAPGTRQLLADSDEIRLSGIVLYAHLDA